MMPIPIYVEYLGALHYNAVLTADADPFLHQSFANSYNHHELHSWDKTVQVPSPEFDALYAEL